MSDPRIFSIPFENIRKTVFLMFLGDMEYVNSELFS